MELTAPLIRNVLFPAWVWKNHSARTRYLAALERSQFLPNDQLLDLQWRRFQEVFRHASTHCRFYRDKYKAAGLEPGDIRSLDDVGKLPTLAKQEIQESGDDLIADTVSRGSLLRDMTGGSTGSPMVFYYDNDRLDSRVAATLRHNRWTGWDIGMKMAVLWGAPRDMTGNQRLRDRLRDWILDRRIVLDASALSEARMEQFRQALLAHRPPFMLAYANTMALFARYVQATGGAVHKPKAIICSAEVLTADNRALIQSTFGCPVFNRYGSREFAVIASECASHTAMHVNAENLLVEVREHVDAPDAVEGEIVVSDLRNFAMPMIRYRTMDVGRRHQSPCACGRGLPLIELTGGRTTDFLVATDGSRVSGIVVATYVITNIAGIRQIQFVQRQRGSITVRLVTGPAWAPEAQTLLDARIRRFLGRDIAIIVEPAENIPLEPSGKFRFSVSSLGH